MSKTPIEMMLDGVTWVQTTGSSTDNKPTGDKDELYATHEGVFEFMGHKMRCYRLNTGQAVFNADDFEDFFSTLAGDSNADS